MKKLIIYILILFSFTSVKAMNVNAPQKVYPGSNFQVTVGGNFASAIVKINFNGGLSKAMIDDPSRIDDHYQSHTFTLKAPSKVGSYNINVILEQTFSGETMKTETRNVTLNVIVPPSNNKPTPKPNTPTNNTRPNSKPKTGGNKAATNQKKAKAKDNKKASTAEIIDNKIIIKINDEDYEYLSSLPYEGYEASKIKIADKEVEVYKKDDKYLIKVLKDGKEYYALYDEEYKLVTMIDNKIITDIKEAVKSPSTSKKEMIINDIKIKTLAIKNYEDLYLVSLLDEKEVFIYDVKTKRISPFIKLKEEEKVRKKPKEEEGLLAYIGINSKKSFITVMSLLLLLLGHFIFDIIYISKKKRKANTLN